MKLIDLIKSISKRRCFVKDFPDGKIFGFQDIDDNCIIYRISYIDTKETGDFAYDWQMKQPMETEMVACGLIAFYLRFPDKDFKQLFEDYYSIHWRMFLEEKNRDKQKNFDFLMKEEEEQKAGFHLSHIGQEKRNAEISRALFSYLEESDVVFLEKLVKQYLKWLGEKVVDYLPTTEMLETIFKNNHGILQQFLHRIKGKKGAKIVDEVIALTKMGLIDEEENGEELRKELSTLGYNTTTKQNWRVALNKQRSDSSIKAIQAKYQ